jgi:hypothetical protein
MKKLPYILGGVALLLAAVLAYVYFAEIRPWFAPPDAPAWAIEERWKKVEELAALPEECGSDPCADHGDTLQRFQRARDELGVDRKANAAALELGSELRRCGDFIEVNMGFVLAEIAVEQSRAHGRRADQAFVELRPRVEDVLPSLARDAVCLVRLARGADAEQQGPAPAPTRDPVGMDRELLFLKQYYADLLLPFAADPTDLEGLAAALEPADEEQLPKSLLLRGAVAPGHYASQVRKLAEIIAEYDAFLAEGTVDAGADGG